MKKLFLCLSLFVFDAHAQHAGIGSIRLKGFSNRDNMPANNVRVPSLHVCIVDSQSGDTLIMEQAGLPIDYDFPPGTYNLTAMYDDFKPIVLREIPVNADRMTFVDLLFEPEPRYRKGFATGVDRRRRKTKKG